MRVVIVDDQQLIRRGLALLLSTIPGVEVVGEAGDGRQALAVVASVRPDVVLSDAQMPGMDGIELTEALRDPHPDLPVVILTTFDDDDLVRAALAAGASGFLLKDSAPEDLASAMQAVAGGGLVIDPRVARAALTRPGTGTPTEPEPLAVLTATERTVAAHVATGATNGEIAERLVLAEGTVKNHVSALLRKLDQRDRTGLALLLSRYLGPSDR